MSLRWYVSIPPIGLAAVSQWRLEPALSASWEGETLWLRLEPSPAWEKRLRGAPLGGRWEAEDDARSMRRLGELLPDCSVPPGPWKPLAECLSVGPGPRTRPAAFPLTRQAVRLVAWDSLPPADREAWGRTGESGGGAPQAWLGDVRLLHDFVVDQPAVRTQRLVFAVDVSGDALVLGRDLPPLPAGPGLGWYGRFQYDLVRPLGWVWSPPVDDFTMAGLLREEGEVALCLPGGGVQRLAKASFAALTRSAIRATYAPFAARGKREGDS